MQTIGIYHAHVIGEFHFQYGEPKMEKKKSVLGLWKNSKHEMQKAVQAGVLENDIFEDFIVGDHRLKIMPKLICIKTLWIHYIGIAFWKPMHRESDLIDVWFDSGIMPYAQWHYPFENKELIDDNKAFPADFIAEGVDQTRGWFYTLHALQQWFLIL